MAGKIHFSSDLFDTGSLGAENNSVPLGNRIEINSLKKSFDETAVKIKQN